MVKKTSQIILLSLFVVLTATAQKREKYEFIRNLPVYADSLIADLTYPMAWGNSEITDFDEWKRQPDAVVQLPARDIVKLAELIHAAKEDWLKDRPNKRHLNFMERIAKSCGLRWIGVNSSYDEIKETYSNERLRKERAEREKGHGEGVGNHSTDGEGTEH